MIMTNTMKTNQKEVTTVNPPTLPPLYFAQKEENNNSKNQSSSPSSPSSSSFPIEPLPSEVLCNITSYLDWGDYARLSVTNKSFQSMMHDAATLSDQKFDLAMALLNGINGLESNPSLAMKYFHDLAGIKVTVDDYKPTYQEMMKDDNSNINDNDNAIEKEQSTLAMKKLASCLLEGNGVDIDLKLGLAWLKAAHYHGDIEAAYEIATMYEYSKHGVEVDIYAAAEWFHGAATAGHVESMAEYAMCLELGCGVEQSDDQALDWYTRAAEAGHVTSNFSVGEMFEEARGGLPQSDTEAVLWYYKAAMMGDEDSKKALKRLSDIARIVLPGWAAALNE